MTFTDRFGREITKKIVNDKAIYIHGGILIEKENDIKSDSHAIHTFNSMKPEGWIEPQEDTIL